MISWLICAVAIMLSLPATPQEVRRSQLIHFLSASDAEVACAISGSTSRSQRNVIVWPRGGTLAALAFRADLTSTVTPQAPCWSPPGQCALFEGDLPGAANLCATSPGLRGSGAQYTGSSRTIPPSVRTRDGSAAIAPELEALADTLMPLANGLTGAETWISLLDGHPVYMSEGERGTRQVRIDGPGGMFTIARLRPAYDTLDLPGLETAMTALGTRELALVGPSGVLSDDGRVYLSGQCFAAAPPDQLRSRLVMANAAFPLESPPDEAEAEAAFDDIVQGLLGGTPVYGDPLGIVVQQDARILLFVPGETDLCP